MCIQEPFNDMINQDKHGYKSINIFFFIVHCFAYLRTVLVKLCLVYEVLGKSKAFNAWSYLHDIEQIINRHIQIKCVIYGSINFIEIPMYKVSNVCICDYTKKNVNSLE